MNATLYQIDGLDFSPTYLWLDGQRTVLAAIFPGGALVRAGYESLAPTLQKAQQEIESARAASLAKQFIHHPQAIFSSRMQMCLIP